MPDFGWACHLGAALASLGGFACLALAMDEHWAQVHGSAAPPARLRRVLRALGAGGLAASALLCLLADRPSMAVLVWLMLLAATAPLVSLLLAWRPQLLRFVTPPARR